MPLPDEWLGVLIGLQENPELPPARPLPSLGVLVDACLEALPEQRAPLLWARLGAGQTLQEVGELHGITRERVRQVVQKQSRALLKDSRLRLVLDGVLSGLGQGGAVLVDVRGAHSKRIPEASPEQLWNFVMELWRLVRGSAVACSAPTPLTGMFVFTPDQLLDERAVRSLLTERGSFLTLAELAEGLGKRPSHVEILACACSRLTRTRSGLYGLTSWTIPGLMNATAEVLARAGFTEWHYSELGKAVAWFNPALAGLGSRNFAAVLSRSDVAYFEHAGRKGYWRLRTFGDGHQDNRAALRNVLEHTDVPLHWSAIQKQLARHVQEGTILALLSREDEFQSFGRGVFGLRARDYRSGSAEEAFMQTQFAQAGQAALAVPEVQERAVLAGLDPQHLIAVGRYSSEYVYWHWGHNEPLFLTLGEARRRHFQRWFHRRHERSCPDASVLLEGLRDAFERRDREVLRLSNMHLQERQVCLPTEALPWVEWALSAE